MLINSLFYYHANAFWDINRNLSRYDDEGYYNSLTYRVYIEHGISRNVTGILNFPYTKASFQNLDFSESRHSGGDIEAGLAWRFYERSEDFMLSARLLFIWPSYDTKSTPVPGFGYSGIDAQLIAAGGFMLGNREAFYAVSGGFRKYLGTNIYQWLYSIGGGFNLRDHLELLFELSGRWSESSDETFTPEDLLLNTNFDFHKAGIGLLWMVSPDNLGFLAQVYTDYSGSRVAKGKSASFAVILFF